MFQTNLPMSYEYKASARCDKAPEGSKHTVNRMLVCQHTCLCAAQITSAASTKNSTDLEFLYVLVRIMCRI